MGVADVFRGLLERLGELSQGVDLRQIKMYRGDKEGNARTPSGASLKERRVFFVSF